MPLETLQIFVGESRLYNFDFTAEDEIVAGDTIVSAVVTKVSPAAVALTIGTPVIGTKIVQVRLSAAVDNTTYHLKCVATTTAGNILVLCGQLAASAC